MRFTLDTNCILDVEDKRPNAPFLRQLVGLHQKDGIVIGVSAIGASERQRAGGYAQSFAEFQAKLKAIGFDALELLRPLAYWDIAYWDYCVGPDENDTLENDIHNVLFPNIEFLWVAYASSRGLSVEAHDSKWRNAKCDVLALWCHIKHRGNVFVTSDSNFHAETKHKRLEALGAKTIAFPMDALALAQRI